MTIDELEECIRLYGKDIYAFCRQLTQNRLEAEDLYQDTFLKATELSEKMDRGRNPRSYLISIALRIWKNRKRKFAWRKRIADTKQYMEESDESREPLSEALEEQLISEEEKQRIRQAVDRLEDKYRIPVLLYYMEELSTESIAKLMKLPSGTVKSRLYTARKLLKKDLEVFFE